MDIVSQRSQAVSIRSIAKSVNSASSSARPLPDGFSLFHLPNVETTSNSDEAKDFIMGKDRP
jgi:hypothetical protein